MGPYLNIDDTKEDLNNLITVTTLEKSIEQQQKSFKGSEIFNKIYTSHSEILNLCFVSKNLNSTWNYITFASGDGIHVETGCSSEDRGNLRDLSATAVLLLAGKKISLFLLWEF